MCMCACVWPMYVPTYVRTFVVMCTSPTYPADLFRGQPALPTGSDAGDPWHTQYVYTADRHCSGDAAQLAFPSPSSSLSPSPSLPSLSLSPPPPSPFLSPFPLLSPPFPSSLLLFPPLPFPPPHPPPHSFPSTGFHNQYQLTLITVEKSNSQSGDYLAKVLKQKLYVSEIVALSWSLAGMRVLVCCSWMVGVGRSVGALTYTLPRCTYLYRVHDLCCVCVVRCGVAGEASCAVCPSPPPLCLLFCTQADSMEVLMQEIYGLENKKVLYLVGWVWQ